MSTYVRKTRYQSPAVAGEYDTRFLSAAGQVENHKTLPALAQALQVTSGVAAVLDMPCGTGRLRQFFVDRGYIYTGADISLDVVHIDTSKVCNYCASPDGCRASAVCRLNGRLCRVCAFSHA